MAVYRFVLDARRPKAHDEGMSNYRPKGKEFMRGIAKLGGVASGVTRHKQKVAKDLGMEPVPVLPAEPNPSGCSHDSDWRCVNPECRHFNSIKRRACAKCRMPGPRNGRWTRKRLRERADEHRIRAILDKHEV